MKKLLIAVFFFVSVLYAEGFTVCKLKIDMVERDCHTVMTADGNRLEKISGNEYVYSKDTAYAYEATTLLYYRGRLLEWRKIVYPKTEKGARSMVDATCIKYGDWSSYKDGAYTWRRDNQIFMIVDWGDGSYSFGVAEL